jgi:hypothetical protein
VKEIASAAAANPAAESKLLRLAQTESLSRLAHRCAQVRATADPDEVSRYEAVRRRSRLRHWTDPEGAFRLDAVLTADAGAVILAAVEPHQARIFAEARRQGRREPSEAYAADALVAIAAHARDCGGRPRGGLRADRDGPRPGRPPGLFGREGRRRSRVRDPRGLPHPGGEGAGAVRGRDPRRAPHPTQPTSGRPPTSGG